jgi:hypothetical protein
MGRCGGAIAYKNGRPRNLTKDRMYIVTLIPILSIINETIFKITKEGLKLLKPFWLYILTPSDVDVAIDISKLVIPRLFTARKRCCSTD